jgi:hypothetical protein
MMTLAEVVILARGFWLRVGENYEFPRNIERAAMTALPVVIVKIPRLTSDGITTWFRSRSVEVAVPASESGMLGCLVAHRGRGVVFVDGTEGVEEQRATVAHEIAHFIRHYLALRDRAFKALGPAVVEVLDGDRPPTFAERALSVLHDAPIGIHVHFMPRDHGSDFIAQIEREADELALELVAPRQAALQALGALTTRTPRQRRKALAAHFGLPEEWLRAYAPDPHRTRPDPLGAIIEKLRVTR